ncbi:MAG: chaperone NapD [Gammaproteobacteria bacterium]|nr:chaperone NapD [Gammaproteobacteria bacterium]
MSEAANNESINICGVLVHARPDIISNVKTDLQAFEGLEVHDVTNDGRLVITIDLPDRSQMIETINQLNSVTGVISAAMVYQHTE